MPGCRYCIDQQGRFFKRSDLKTAAACVHRRAGDRIQCNRSCGRRRTGDRSDQYTGLQHRGGGTDGLFFAAGFLQPCKRAQRRSKKGKMVRMSGLLLLGFSHHRAGRKNHGHRWIWQYRAADGKDCLCDGNESNRLEPDSKRSGDGDFLSCGRIPCRNFSDSRMWSVFTARFSHRLII